MKHTQRHRYVSLLGLLVLLPLLLLLVWLLTYWRNVKTEGMNVDVFVQPVGDSYRDYRITIHNHGLLPIFFRPPDEESCNLFWHLVDGGAWAGATMSGEQFKWAFPVNTMLPPRSSTNLAVHLANYPFLWLYRWQLVLPYHINTNRWLRYRYWDDSYTAYANIIEPTTSWCSHIDYRAE